MTPLPTGEDRDVRHADFPTLAAALDFAAQGVTGVTLHGARGEVVEALSYFRLRAEARERGARLLASGLRVGDRVGLAAETDATFVRDFFACVVAGLVPLPLPLPAPLGGRDAYVGQIARMLASARAAAVFGPDAYSDWLAEAASEVAACANPPLAEAGNEAALPLIGPDNLCYLQFSSGSTRNPTGVMVTHRSLMANCVAITRHGLQVTAADRAVSWLPLYHDMGLIGFLLAPLSCQMTVDLLPTSAFVRRPLLWPELMSRNAASISYSPTFGYELAAKRAETAAVDGYDLSRWRIAGVGGDMVRPGPLNDFAERFAQAAFSSTAFVASYGMAEATLAVAMAALGQGLQTTEIALDTGAAGHTRAFTRCGPPLPDHEIRIVDATDRPAPDGEVGRILVRGPSLMQGYFDLSDETAAVLSPEGWLDTGDLGLIVDGDIVPTGRARDLILHNGRNIWPQDLEWAVENEIDGVRSGDVAAFQTAADGADAIVILVQTRTGDPDRRQALTDSVSALLRARHGVETRVRLVGAHALPRTTSGKLSRSKARSLYLAGAFDGVGA